jgi:2-alkyl-3-oxoalkanoate reductase
MKVLIAGGSGAIGRRLIPELIAQGHEVTALTRSERRKAGLEELGSRALVVDALDGPAVMTAVTGAEPEVVIAQRAFPIIGDGAGVWSFVHIDDAAAVTLAALEHGRPGVYNIADDEPAPVAQWLPYFAEVSGAKAPMHVPAWLGRMAAGEAVVSMMTRIRGAANGLAKREFDWELRYPSWRQGFAATFGRAPASTGATT